MSNILVSSADEFPPQDIDIDFAKRASLRHLNQIQLARRWSLSPRTLERWRWLQEGPKYVKVGGRILYRLEDIEAFEKKCLRECLDSKPVLLPIILNATACRTHALLHQAVELDSQKSGWAAAAVRQAGAGCAIECPITRCGLRQ